MPPLGPPPPYVPEEIRRPIRRVDLIPEGRAVDHERVEMGPEGRAEPPAVDGAAGAASGPGEN